MSDSSADKTSPARSPLGAWLQDRHVLVAEDNLINQRVIQAMLKTARPASLTLCDNGSDALEHALAAPPDIIFMDVHMPLMDGIEATRRIREAGLHLPIVAVTANITPENRERCMDAGMSGYLTKPIDPVSLSEALQKIFLAPDNFTALPAEHPAELQDDLEIFDAEGFMAAFCHDSTLCREVIVAFQDQTMDLIEEIERAMHIYDFDTIAKAYHKLNGSAQTVRAPKMQEICRRGEFAAQNRADDESLCVLLTDLLSVFTELRRDFSQVYPALP